MQIKPLWDRVLLKAVEKENISESGIFIPEALNKERPYIYEVMATWEGTKDVEITVKTGDKILSWQYSWDDVKVDWVEYKIVAMQYILAIVD